MGGGGGGGGTKERKKREKKQTCSRETNLSPNSPDRSSFSVRRVTLS